MWDPCNTWYPVSRAGSLINCEFNWHLFSTYLLQFLLLPAEHVLPHFTFSVKLRIHLSMWCAKASRIGLCVLVYTAHHTATNRLSLSYALHSLIHWLSFHQSETVEHALPHAQCILDRHYILCME